MHAMLRAAFMGLTSLLVLLLVPAGALLHAAESKPNRDLEFLEAVSWGATQASYDELSRLGRERWLERQLTLQDVTVPPALQQRIDGFRVSTTTPLALAVEFTARNKVLRDMPEGDERQAAFLAIQVDMSVIAREAAMRSAIRAIYAPDQLRERLTWFWFNHFNVHSGKATLRLLVGDYEDKAIRPHALGRFRDLLGATVHHPAMLTYLDNIQNIVGHVNENYARELLELHTMGVGSGYTQKDVEQLARILTGFGIQQDDTPPRMKPELLPQYRREGLFAFHPARHDYGDKVFLGHRIKGRGEQELEEVLDIIATQPATARHVSTRLATYFMTDKPPPRLVDAMAAEFLRTGGMIPAVLRVLFRAPEFDQALGRRPKDSVRYVYSAVRLAYEEKPILNALPVLVWLNRLSEGLYNRSTPDGYPLASEDWTGPGQMAARFEIARAIASGPAGLFRIGDEKADRPGFPVLRNELFYRGWQSRLSPATRTALDQAISPQDWNTLFLSSPEFMQGGGP